jgi:hypothetical protein
MIRCQKGINVAPEKEKSGFTEVFSFRTTRTGGDAWRKKIAQSGYSRSEFFRKAVEQNQTVVQGDAGTKIRNTRTKHTMPPDIRRLLFLAAQTSNNCNQIAHSLNSAALKDRINPALIEAIFAELQTINRAAKDWI